MLVNPPYTLRKSLSAVILTAGFLMVGCGAGSDDSAEDSPSATESVSPSAQAEETTLPDFTDGSLYDAIIFARENDMSYELENAEIADIENTREVTVTEQSPEADSEFSARDVLTLTIEDQ